MPADAHGAALRSTSRRMPHWWPASRHHCRWRSPLACRSSR
jgi:hypothetical protein